jgi:hypothetical protein
MISKMERAEEDLALTLGQTGRWHHTVTGVLSLTARFAGAIRPWRTVVDGG